DSPDVTTLDDHLIADLHRAADGLDTPSESHLTADGPASGTDVGQTRKLRVDLEKLDSLLNLTGELSIAAGKLREGIKRLPDPYGEQMTAAYEDVERTFTELQTQVTRVRMVPIGPRLEQQRRTVRDLAEISKKPIRLEIEGRDVEIDASLIEHIKDPLTH